MKRLVPITVILCCLWLIPKCHIQAQSLESSFEFLKLPISARSSSLGGHTVSVFDQDPALYITNPAVLSACQERLLGLNAMSWFSNTTVAGAQFCNRFDDRSRYAFNARYVSYGKMDQTSPDGSVTGTFTAKDMALGATWAYMLTDKLSGGVTAVLINSNYAHLSSVAIGVDLGLLYTDGSISVGVTAANLGGQIKAFENTFQKMPFDLCAGLTWSPTYAPFQFTISMDNLTKWKSSDFYFTDGADHGFGEIFKRHLSIGAEFYISEPFYVAAGCNFRNRAELSTEGSQGLIGCTIGTGIRIGKVMFDLSYGKYQVSESSLICNVALKI